MISRLPVFPRASRPARTAWGGKCAAAGLLALSLSACTPHLVRGEGWTFQLGRTQGAVRLMPREAFGVCAPTLIGCTVPLGHSCLVMLDRAFFLKGTAYQRAALLAHEVGHCLDGAVLEYGHGGFGREGRVYGAYYASPAEGFAEAFARAYLAKCGLNLAPLGYGEGPACEVPDPREIRPPTAEVRRAGR
ncbi:hypothetical protein SAMN04488058_10193 [Deinococcus reticulitermitis]|uniref:Uncharacterized protein n=1 Tax=Deinococcus reticulitermitis TaxID=856736 RepID=A0A1H6S593_9DEIO|nr:hypothetical protein [Deinococcus reticulitermitis]SEI59957.1 hypothetical protein SAMN04488058_10193 [Deinococcus reticulitermitis]